MDQKQEAPNMNLPYIMDTMFDLLNESDNLNIQDIIENESEGKFYLVTGDGTKLLIHCQILP